MLSKFYANSYKPHTAAPANEVIVKLRTNDQAKRMMSSIGTGNDGRSIFSVLFDQQKIIRFDSLFPSQNRINYIDLNTKALNIDSSRVAMEDIDDPNLSGLNIMEFTSAQDAASAITALLQNPLVEYAHIPALRTYATADPQLNRQWGLRAIDYFNASTAVDFQNGKNIKVAILDSGIDPNHPDLAGVHSVNVNFSTLGADDDTGHGTHVAGIIAAITNNGIGITGVCGSTELMILRGLTKPYQAQAYYDAIRYAFLNGAQILNCSLGGPHDPTEALLMQTAISKGVIVVAAMGNDFLSGNPISYPAALPDVIAVGACTETDNRAPFSQTGSHIDLVAPGTNILSTTPTYKVPFATSKEYDTWDGTSMATPFVSAAVALLLAKKPSATLPEIVEALHRSSVKISGQSEFTNELGHGKLNISGALQLV